MCIYLEIFELHFYDLDKNIRINIIKRGEEEQDNELIQNKKKDKTINKSNEEKSKNIATDILEDNNPLDNSFNRFDVDNNYYTNFDDDCQIELKKTK